MDKKKNQQSQSVYGCVLRSFKLYLMMIQHHITMMMGLPVVMLTLRSCEASFSLVLPVSPGGIRSIKEGCLVHGMYFPLFNTKGPHLHEWTGPRLCLL